VFTKPCLVQGGPPIPSLLTALVSDAFLHSLAGQLVSALVWRLVVCYIPHHRALPCPWQLGFRVGVSTSTLNLQAQMASTPFLKACALTFGLHLGTAPCCAHVFCLSSSHAARQAYPHTVTEGGAVSVVTALSRPHVGRCVCVQLLRSQRKTNFFLRVLALQMLTCCVPLLQPRPLTGLLHLPDLSTTVQLPIQHQPLHSIPAVGRRALNAVCPWVHI
jgi:hypothetical protein